MAVRQVSEKEWTKDGRKWIFEVRTKNSLGKIKYYKSKKYLTKKEAQKAERDYLQEIDTSNGNEEMTFKELCDKHFEYQKDKVKITTLRNYIKRREADFNRSAFCRLYSHLMPILIYDVIRLFKRL